MHRVRVIAGAVCSADTGSVSSCPAAAAAVQSSKGPTLWCEVAPGTRSKFYHPLIPAAAGNGTLDAPRTVSGFSRNVPPGDRALPVIVMAGAKPGSTLLVEEGSGTLPLRRLSRRKAPQPPQTRFYSRGRIVRCYHKQKRAHNPSLFQLQFAPAQ